MDDGRYMMCFRRSGAVAQSLFYFGRCCKEWNKTDRHQSVADLCRPVVHSLVNKIDSILAS